MSEPDPNLQPLRAVAAGDGRPPLFLVAAPGVNALGYVGLARRLPRGQAVYAVQPRRRGRTFPDEGIGPGGRDEHALVAAEYLASLRAVQPSGPYQLAGMCDGALIAFHLARLLEAEGERVALLGILDTWPLENTSVYPLVMWKVWRRAWQERTAAQRRDFVRQKARDALGRAAAILDPGAQTTGEGASARRALWRARLWPGRGFRPPVIRAPIAVLRVPHQPYWRIRDDALGWRPRTTGVVTVHILPGDHVSWSRPPHVQAFARTLAAYLGDAVRDGGSPEPPAPARGAAAV